MTIMNAIAETHRSRSSASPSLDRRPPRPSKFANHHRTSTKRVRLQKIHEDPLDVKLHNDEVLDYLDSPSTLRGYEKFLSVRLLSPKSLVPLSSSYTTTSTSTSSTLHRLPAPKRMLQRYNQQDDDPWTNACVVSDAHVFMPLPLFLHANDIGTPDYQDHPIIFLHVPPINTFLCIGLSTS